MSNKHLLSKNVKLTLVMLAALAFIYVAQPYVSEFRGSEKNKAPDQKSEPSANLPAPPQTQATSVQSLTPGADPFKAHIEKNRPLENKAAASTTPSTIPNTNPKLPSGNTVSSGSDPFKAFLEEQKKQTKDAGISPFGK
jgi:hypothetical protein